MNKLSTGDPSTLGSYIKLCKAFGFTKAQAYFEEKAYAAPHGEEEEVLADERQVMVLVVRLEVGN